MISISLIDGVSLPFCEEIKLAPISLLDLIPTFKSGITKSSTLVRLGKIHRNFLGKIHSNLSGSFIYDKIDCHEIIIEDKELITAIKDENIFIRQIHSFFKGGKLNKESTIYDLAKTITNKRFGCFGSGSPGSMFLKDYVRKVISYLKIDPLLLSITLQDDNDVIVKYSEDIRTNKFEAFIFCFLCSTDRNINIKLWSKNQEYLNIIQEKILIKILLYNELFLNVNPDISKYILSLQIL